jgi:chromate transporter
VLAIVLVALDQLRRRALRGAFAAWIAAGAFVALFFLQLPFPAVIAVAALAGAWRAWTGRSDAAVPAEAAAQSRPLLTAAVGLAAWLGRGRAARLAHSGLATSRPRSACSSARWRW